MLHTLRAPRRSLAVQPTIHDPRGACSHMHARYTVRFSVAHEVEPPATPACAQAHSSCPLFTAALLSLRARPAAAQSSGC